MSGLISKIFGTSSAPSASPYYAAGTPGASYADASAAASAPAGYASVPSGYASVPSVPNGYTVPDPSAASTLTPDAYSPSGSVPISAYQVPTHVPSVIPGGVVGWKSFETLPPDVRQRVIRVPVQEQVPTAAPRAPRAPRAANPDLAPNQYDASYEDPAYGAQSGRAGAYDSSYQDPAYGAQNVRAGNASRGAASGARIRGENGQFLPADTIQPEGLNVQDGSVRAPRAPRGARGLSSDASDLGARSGQGRQAALAADGAPVRTRVRMETRVKTFAAPKVSMAAVGDMAKTSALWGGVISLGLNTYSILKHQETFGQGGANVVGDVASSAVGGVAGALTASFGTAALASVFGIGLAGLPLTVASVALGFGGFWVADHFFRKTSIFQSIQHDVRGLLGG